MIRVPEAEEIDEVQRLRREVRRLKEALADAHVDLALEEALTELLGEKAGIQDLAAFKKKHGGSGRTGR